MDELLNVHGGDVYSYISDTGVMPVDYSSNINPLGLPESVKQALRDGVDSFSLYPDVRCRELRIAVAGYENTDGERLAFGNGAADLIFRLCRVVRPSRALLIAPAFLDYERALLSVNCMTEHFYLMPDDGFRLTDAILDKIQGHDILFICNPNNPTGVPTEKDLMFRIAQRCAGENCILVIDECFMDFVAEKNKYCFNEYMHLFENVVILKAFTKIFAMPGLRLGYCMSSSRKMITELERSGQTWSVSVPAQIAGKAALKETDYLKRTLEIITGEREYLSASLTALGCRVFPGSANFLLFSTGIEDLYQKLYRRGILIRNCGNFRGLDSRYYRAAVKLHENNKLFIHEMTDLAAGHENGEG
jgi:threonine-phosphate decarboxylase